MEKAIEFYKTIESLPEFQDEFVYHMEFGTNPGPSIYQFRPFRKKEKSPWKLNLKEFDKEYGNNFNSFGLCFGITPKEGLELTLARALSVHNQERYIKFYRDNLIGKPSKEIVNALMKEWNLSQFEKPYAAEVSKIEKNVCGHNESEAFDNAIKKINKKMDKENTCIFQQSMHFYYGKDIDLVFPNAKVWIADGGSEFLSHNWFRAAQTYDVALLGYSSQIKKTGDKVRIFSDGVTGVII